MVRFAHVGTTGRAKWSPRLYPLVRFPPALSQLKQCEVRNLPCDEFEAHRGTLRVPAGMPARTRVDVEQRQFLISHHTHDVRMATDKQVGFAALQFPPDAHFVTAGISTDVRHVDTHILTAPFEILRQAGSNLGTIDITKHAPNGFDTLQLVQHLRSAEVAS